MQRWLSLAVKYVVVLGLALFLLDWVVYAVRRADGGGMATVVVKEPVMKPPKGQERGDRSKGKKVRCAEALFPHGVLPVCWWVRRYEAQGR